LVLAHRHSEWTGHAPILEEDIAFTNLALDELGHASVWYRLAAGLLREDPDTYPDRLIFGRPAAEYRNVRMVELPIGDWAFSMLRQYLFDAAEQVRLEALTASRHEELAQAAAKIRTEETYHLRHTRAWVQRLGLGTQESNRRTQQALDELYSAAGQLFAPVPDESDLAAAGLVGDPAAQQEAWARLVGEHLAASGLQLPGHPKSWPADRREHTPHLATLVGEMQEVARLEAEASW
jgi:ring-1,2-phenylacetyl-CoA epoxidase subunit PaaC